MPAKESDTVQSGITYTLGANLENLTLTGTTAIDGTGNELDNILTGNSGANILNGALGADTMRGGMGDDVYVVDHINDVAIENINEGIDLVQSGISCTLGNNIENLTLSGTFDINGTGNTLANVLIGNSGVNALKGDAGSDILRGEAGNDILYGGAGDDIFEFNLGDGQDTIQLDDVAGIDTLVFGAGISMSNLRFMYAPYDLIIKIGDAGDQVVLNDWYYNNMGYRLEPFQIC